VTRAAAILVASLALVATASAGSRPASVAAHASRFGTILFDGRGYVLYTFSIDRGKSRCNGACAAAWPPFIVTRAPAARAGAKRSLVGVVRRAGGRLQATYAGRPLYYYVGDRKPGQILCQAVSEYGGLWLVVRPNGVPVR
jgi:predicted lipoprotein with Yx(FWY)xxD motif